MTPVHTSAPGKVVVSGEYAVLDGAPAIVMAVDRRAVVRATEAGGDWHNLSVPGLVDRVIEFRMDTEGDVILRDPGATAFDLTLVWEVWNAAGAGPGRMLQLELDTRAFFHETKRMKLGFGSSAALAVALAFALLSGARRVRDVADVARAAHQAWQGGHGSGVDVAAAVHGGILGYRATPGVLPEALAWPKDFHHALLWSGRAASTRDEVAKLGCPASGGNGRAADRLADIAEAVLDAWRGGNPVSILERLSAYVGALESFAIDRQLGIFDAGHRELVEAADGRDLVYKPCGAGGGDIGIVVALDEEALDRFVDHACELGFERLNVTPDMRGVEGYPEP